MSTLNIRPDAQDDDAHHPGQAKDKCRAAQPLNHFAECLMSNGMSFDIFLMGLMM